MLDGYSRDIASGFVVPAGDTSESDVAYEVEDMEKSGSDEGGEAYLEDEEGRLGFGMARKSKMIPKALEMIRAWGRSRQDCDGFQLERRRMSGMGSRSMPLLTHHIRIRYNASA